MNKEDNNNKKKDDFPYVYVGNEREAETLDSPDPAPPNQGAADIYSCRCVVLLKKNTASIFEGSLGRASLPLLPPPLLPQRSPQGWPTLPMRPSRTRQGHSSTGWRQLSRRSVPHSPSLARGMLPLAAWPVCFLVAWVHWRPGWRVPAPCSIMWTTRRRCRAFRIVL